MEQWKQILLAGAAATSLWAATPPEKQAAILEAAPQTETAPALAKAPSVDAIIDSRIELEGSEEEQKALHHLLTELMRTETGRDSVVRLPPNPEKKLTFSFGETKLGGAYEQAAHTVAMNKSNWTPFDIMAAGHEIQHALLSLDNAGVLASSQDSLKDAFTRGKLEELDAMLKECMIGAQHQKLSGKSSLAHIPRAAIYQSALRAGERKFAALPEAGKNKKAQEYAATQFVKAFWGEDSELPLTPAQKKAVREWNDFYGLQTIQNLHIGQKNPQPSRQNDDFISYYISSLGADITPQYMRENVSRQLFGSPLTFGESEITVLSEGKTVALVRQKQAPRLKETLKNAQIEPPPQAEKQQPGTAARLLRNRGGR